MDKLFEQAAKIIEAAARSPLGILALMVLALSGSGVLLFRDASEGVRLTAFGLLFTGCIAFAAALATQRQGRGFSSDTEADVRPMRQVTLRRTAGRGPPESLTATLVRLGLYDSRRNPAGAGPRHEYRQHLMGNIVTVVDEATGLQWQTGALCRATRTAADALVADANAQRFAGYADWRLPTVEEAAGLLTPEASCGWHIDALFGRDDGHFIWCADTAEEGVGWVVYFADGIVARESAHFNAAVRLVRTAGGDSD